MKVYILNWFFRKLYTLISYNRKVIVAAKESCNASIDCTPDYSFFWRWLLIILCYTTGNIFIIAATGRMFSFYKINCQSYIIINWMIVPVTLSMFSSKKQATDIHAHASVTSCITGFLLFTASYFLKYFYHTPVVLYCIILLIVWLSMQQIIKRYHYLQQLYKR